MKTGFSPNQSKLKVHPDQKFSHFESEIWNLNLSGLFLHQSFFTMQLCKLNSPWEQLQHKQMSVIQSLKEIKHCRCAFVFAKFGGSTQCWEMRHSVLLLLLLPSGANVQSLIATKGKWVVIMPTCFALFSNYLLQIINELIQHLINYKAENIYIILSGNSFKIYVTQSTG